MSELSRRDLLKFGLNLAALWGMSSALGATMAQGAEALAAGTVPVLWLQAQSCSGCSVSTINSDRPGPAQILTQLISLRFNATLAAATGHLAVEVIKKTIEAGDFYLVVEGAIPAGMPGACVVGDEPVTRQITRAAGRAKAIIAMGTCASFGGVPAAQGNPTGAVSLPAYLKSQSIGTALIAIPGCPPHPDWLVGTLVHLIKFGIPALDDQRRPKAFFGRLIHDQCPRFADYEREKFAQSFSDEGCLFHLGCLGPDTRADCTLRSWNSGINNCLRAGAPCVGCASPNFAARTSFAFYPREELAQTAKRKLESAP